MKSSRWVQFTFLTFVVFAALSPVTFAQDARFLHVLLITDTDDAIIGKSTQVDGRNVSLRILQEVPEHRRQLTVLYGRKVTEDDILNYYRNLRVQRDDCVFCYFAGHGRMEDGEHVLGMSDATALKRSTLLKAMKDKGARLTILISDACASFDGEPGRKVEAPVLPRRSELARYLFFRHRGVVDVNSAVPPQEAFGDDATGGLFTQAFSRLLIEPNERFDRNNDGMVGWDEFFSQLTEKTETNFRLFRMTNPKLRQTQQTPKAWQLAALVPNARIEFATLQMGVGLSDAAGGGARIDQVYAGSPAEWHGLRVGHVVRRMEIMETMDTRKVWKAWTINNSQDVVRAVQSQDVPTLWRLIASDPAVNRSYYFHVRTLGKRALGPAPVK